MATKKWALDNKGDLIYIDNVERETDAFCIECGEKLIYNKGEKHCDAYWRHGSKSKCKGGSTESLIHLLSKKLFLDGNISTMKIPASTFIVSSKCEVVDKPIEINLSDYIITDEKFIPNTSIKPDLTLVNKNNGLHLYIEVRNTHAVSAKKLIRYKNLKDVQNFNFEVVEIDVRSALTTLESNDLEELIQILSGKVEDKSVVVMSSKLAELHSENSKSTFKYNSQYGVCPNGDLVTPADCSGCAYLISKNGNSVVCNGKLAYLSVSDILNRKIRTKEDRLDCEPVPICKYKLISILDEKREKVKSQHIEGSCKKCGKPTILVTGKQSNVRGIMQKDNFYDKNKVLHCHDLELEKWCPYCNTYEKIYCPECAKKKIKVPITVWNNTDKNSPARGSVYARCSEQRDGGCGYAITLFKNDKCNEYAEELMFVNGIDTFIRRPSEFKKAMAIIRPFVKNILSKGK